ncbi:DUF6585 family protein [Rugosimonospora africana]|uniref:Uncharacterized protein n=1 Tax=Rugosimonospora africana TaxID=556532 RepID=A0A8J3R300_9ACTN|nr:DUF6585 family protein [Rugosimonospora africana]GIH20849.1 hypothetical protein Raf01_90210 [Rugosimonospora africana]
MTQHSPDGVGQQIPPEVAAAAAAYQLGPYVALFGPNRLPKRTAGAIIFGVLAVIGVVVLFTSFWPIGVLLLLACAFGAVQFARSFSVTRSPRRIHLYAGGFVYVDPPAAPVVYRWDLIPAVYQSITKHYRNSVYTHTTYVYTVHGQGDAKVVLTNFWDRIEALGERIEREVTRVHLPMAVAALQRGEPLRFGDLTVAPNGLISEKRGLLPWSDIEKVQVRAGFIHVSRAGKWLSWSNTQVAHIPNLFVFLTLVDSLGPGIRR